MINEQQDEMKVVINFNVFFLMVEQNGYLFPIIY
jgi:hypothetical protein